MAPGEGGRNDVLQNTENCASCRQWTERWKMACTVEANGTQDVLTSWI